MRFDTGPGITEQDREQVFQPFFRAATNGTGSAWPSRAAWSPAPAAHRRWTPPGTGATFVVELPRRRRSGEPGREGLAHRRRYASMRRVAESTLQEDGLGSRGRLGKEALEAFQKGRSTS